MTMMQENETERSDGDENGAERRTEKRMKQRGNGEENEAEGSDGAERSHEADNDNDGDVATIHRRKRSTQITS